MSPEEIIEAYDVLAQNIQDRTAADAASIGNAQRSLGTLAERVASPSGQTSGLANYTYNRTLRPVVDTLSTSLVKEGKAAALEKYLADKLREAKAAYENSRIAAAGNNNNNSGSGINSDKGTSYNGRETNEKDDEGQNITYGDMPWSGWGEANDWITGKYNFTLPDGKEVELGGNDESLHTGSNGYYYIYNVKTKKYYKITGDEGGTPGGGRWWTPGK